MGATSGRRKIKQELREGLVEALREAKAGAVAAIGLRSWRARNALRQGIRRYRDERWQRIVALAEASRFPPVTEDDYKPLDVPCEKKPKLKQGEFDAERWARMVESAKGTGFAPPTAEELRVSESICDDGCAGVDARLLAALDLLSGLAAGPRSKRARSMTV